VNPSARQLALGGAAGAWEDHRMADRLEVRRAIAASPEEVFAVVSDPQGQVTIDSSGMLMWAEPGRPTKVGDEFVIHMDREALNDVPLGLYQVTNVVTTFQIDREFAWTVTGGGRRFGHIYGYQLEPIGEGTLVTQYYDWSAVEDEALKGRFPIIPESALRATLGILARTVAPGKDRPQG
jgi:hypothetical protein